MARKLDERNTGDLWASDLRSVLPFPDRVMVKRRWTQPYRSKTAQKGILALPRQRAGLGR